MLKLLRDKGIQKKIFLGLTVVIVISFVISGVIINSDNDKSNSALAKFEKRSIFVREYLDSYRAVQKQADLMYGDKINEMRSLINFKGEAWDRILLLEYAKKERIKVSDHEVVDWITKQPGFQQNGKFNDAFYKMYVEKALRSTPRQFEEEIRQMLTIGKVYEKIKEKSGASDAQIKDAYKNERSEKDFVYGILPRDPFEEKVEVKDKDIEQLYEIVKDKLTSPEKIKLRYFFVSKNDAETNIGAKSALQDKEAGFDEIAQKYNLAHKDTEHFSRNDSIQDFAGALEISEFGFSKDTGETSGWIQTENGHYKVKILDKQVERKMSLDESKNELTRLFRQQKAVEMSINKMKELRNKISKPEDFESVLKQENIEIVSQSNYKTGMFVNGLWPSQGLDKSLEALSENQISEPFDSPKGAAIAKITKIYGFDEKKFEEEKMAFKEQYLAKKSQEEINQVLEKLRDKLKMNLELMKEIFPTDA